MNLGVDGQGRFRGVKINYLESQHHPVDIEHCANRSVDAKYERLPV